MLKLEPGAISQALSRASHRTCSDYAGLFAEKATATDGDASQAWDALAWIARASLAYDPRPGQSFYGLDFLDRFDDDLLRSAADTAKMVGDQELIARCCDLYWVRRSAKKRERADIEYARTALDAYVKSALHLEDPSHWTSTVKRLQRAFALARQLNLKSERQAIIKTVVEMLARHEGRDPLFLSYQLMQMLFDEEAGDPLTSIAICDTAVAGAEAEAAAKRNPDILRRARQYLELRMRWMERAQLIDQIPAVWEHIAKNCETSAGYCLPDNLSVAAHHQQNAVEAWRRARVPKQRIDAAHQRLLDLQQEAVKQFKPMTATIDLSDVAKAAVERVEGRGFTEGLLGLLSCTVPPSEKHYREWVMRDDLVAARLIPAVQLNSQGKPIGVRGAVTGEKDDATYSEIVSRVRQSQTFIARGAILPALHVFTATFPLRQEEVDVLMADSPIVATARRAVLTRGIHAGFCGDWMFVAHAIPPQLEHIVRELFAARGILVSGLDSQGIQREYDLNTLLWLPEAEKVFGADWLLDLRCALIHPFGANIRNRMAHGLMDDAEFYRLEVVYLWWLALRLIMTHTSFTRDALKQTSGSSDVTAAPGAAAAAPTETAVATPNAQAEIEGDKE
jgi:hypothetical protein